MYTFSLASATIGLFEPIIRQLRSGVIPLLVLKRSGDLGPGSARVDLLLILSAQFPIPGWPRC